jgi:hypothetical protein
MLMSETLKPGDPVEWTSAQGRITSKVRKTLTKPTEIKGHHVEASPENPEILVESDKTGARAAHRPGSVKKKKR